KTDASLVELLEHYAGVRPVDPMPHRRLAFYWLESNTRERAIPHLEMLDRAQEKTPVFTTQLAKLYRDLGETEKAAKKANRALHFDPYHAASRELAASVAIENGDLTLARRHIKALTLIEPDRPQHQRRLEAIDRMLETR
ncbi:MAG: hypothetical protein O7G85_17105, partial [Planctomycetota bacterium]|nr:hypothetical protein [Planctomycetota bacterium]